jgi:hypothetical protein
MEIGKDVIGNGIDGLVRPKDGSLSLPKEPIFLVASAVRGEEDSSETYWPICSARDPRQGVEIFRQQDLT